MKSRYKIEHYNYKDDKWYPVKTYKTPHAIFNAMNNRPVLPKHRALYKNEVIELNNKTNLKNLLRRLKLERVLSNDYKN